MTEDHDKHWWYYRRNGKVAGPYAAGLISRYILLNRLAMNDELSTDRNTWRPVSEHDALIPGVMKGDMSDPFVVERLKAARRWADERDREEQRDSMVGEGTPRKASDRRGTGELDEYSHRNWSHRDPLGEQKDNPLLGWAILLLAIGVIGGGGYYVYINRTPVAEIDCAAKPVAGVNWSNCQLQASNLSGQALPTSNLSSVNLARSNLQAADLSRSNLSYANLSSTNLGNARLVESNLLGANLRGADLRGADLQGANLSFGNLSGANLQGVNLQGAVLHKTVWVDGQLCNDNSVGGCVR